MRIMLLTDFYPPHIGGVELQVQALGHALVRRGHLVSVATLRQPGLPGLADDRGVAVHRLPALSTTISWFSGNPDRRYHPPFPDPMFALRLRRLVSRTNADVVMAHGWSAYSAALGLAGSSVPLVLSVRDYGYSCPVRNMLLGGQICSGPALAKCIRHGSQRYGPLKSLGATFGVRFGGALLRRRVRAVHSVSRYVGEIVQRDLLMEQQCPIVTLPDIVLGGVDETSSDLESVRARLPGVPYILFVGALQPHKGLGPLLDAYARLSSPPPLVLIGTKWPDTPKRFPDDVIVITDISHAAVMQAWTGAMFGVAPSIWPDPLPGVVREAMIAGRPVIGTSVGGIVDMISDGVDGLLVPPGDAESLAAAMRRLIDDPEFRLRLGERARTSATAFSGESIAAQFETFFAGLDRLQ